LRGGWNHWLPPFDVIIQTFSDKTGSPKVNLQAEICSFACSH
jgi:hypothetical protein